MKIPLWIGLAALTLLCGCTTLDSTVPPEVSLVDLRFENLSLFETTAVFTLRITNENPFPLVVDGAVHKIALNGHNVGKGLSNARLEVPRLATATDQVTVHIGNLPLLLSAMDISQSSEVDYSVSSTLYVRDESGSQHRLRSSKSGTLRLPETQSQVLQPFAPQAGLNPVPGSTATPPPPWQPQPLVPPAATP